MNISKFLSQTFSTSVLTLITLSFYVISMNANADSGATVDVALSPAGSFKAKTSEVKGEAVQKGNVVSASNITVTLTGLKTGIEVRDKHTLKHLETEKFPEATLISATGTNGKGEGTIKIRGIEKKISGTYKISGNQLDADFPLKLSDFKIGGIRYMGVGVKDEIQLHVSLPLKKQ